MARAEWEYYALSSRLKSERRGTRLKRKRRDKNLIYLNKEMKRIEQEQKNLGYMDLDPPVQRGWKRSFVLKYDVQIGADRDFFQGLLDKINTIQYSHRRDFKKKKRSRGKKIHVERIQELRLLHEYELKKLKLTDRELAFFDKCLSYCTSTGKPYGCYVFNEPGRFRLRTVPNMITRVRYIDPELESRLFRIEQYLERNNLYPRLRRLCWSHRSCRWPMGEKRKYRQILATDPYREMEFENENEADGKE